MATGVVIAIYGVRADRRTKLGTLRLTEDGTVRLGPGFDSWAARFIRRFPVYLRGRPLTIDDGEPWLRELPRHLHGTFIWAEIGRD